MDAVCDATDYDFATNDWLAPTQLVIGTVAAVSGDSLTTAGASCIAAAVLFLLESVADEVQLKRPSVSALRYAAKGSASAAFVVAGARRLTEDVNLATAALFFGLLSCALGDMLLVTKDTFLAGLGVFLLAHVSFSSAFHLSADMQISMVARAAPMAAILLCIAGVFVFPKLPNGTMRAAVIVYSIALLGMTLLASGTGRPDFLAASVLFALSDLGVAFGSFVRPTAMSRASVFLYYWSTALLANALPIV